MTEGQRVKIYIKSENSKKSVEPIVYIAIFRKEYPRYYRFEICSNLGNYMKCFLKADIGKSVKIASLRKKAS